MNNQQILGLMCIGGMFFCSILLAMLTYDRGMITACKNSGAELYNNNECMFTNMTSAIDQVIDPSMTGQGYLVSQYENIIKSGMEMNQNGN